MRSTRLAKYKRKYKKAVIALQILAIWYAAVFSAALLTSPTGAYFNDSAEAMTKIPVGEWETDEWDKSSLVFLGEKEQKVEACEPEKIKVKLKNGGEDMKVTSSYEVYYAADGNPKKGKKLELETDEGTIKKLKSGEEVELTFLAGEPGNYKFKAYQVEGHPGKGELWSETITIECKKSNKTKAGEKEKVEEQPAEEAEEKAEAEDKATEEKDSKQTEETEKEEQKAEDKKQESDKAIDEKQEESKDNQEESEQKQQDQQKQSEEKQVKAADTKSESSEGQQEKAKEQEKSLSKEKSEGDKE
ncbi:amyloid fiber anchoring/assembly protein TapA [Sediminibacillus dalangtanensis]|uniref:Amyloid fiber anchoring/assembly protein TapA n=1 Tax=Sediminibacillus dalangtanensis TaxID=2729421 RepID=A0ABX7VVD4_9BACI|nr:amyloid fiber anchoring/assembly protein TapA [Sediminibacillus dalangtanensis]QTM98307.1 amyloid fiber anchoring/assembly protein TapA [Sediminibacillus dalangtanensis]